MPLSYVSSNIYGFQALNDNPAVGRAISHSGGGPAVDEDSGRSAHDQVGRAGATGHITRAGSRRASEIDVGRTRRANWPSDVGRVPAVHGA